MQMKGCTFHYKRRKRKSYSNIIRYFYSKAKMIQMIMKILKISPQCMLFVFLNAASFVSLTQCA